MTFPSKVRPSRAWRRTSARSPGSTSGASTSGTPTAMRTRVGAGDDEERVAGAARDGEVAGVDVATDHDAVVRGDDLRVADHGLGPTGLGLGDVDARLGGHDVGAGLVQLGRRLGQGRLGGADLGRDLVAAGPGRFELAAGLVAAACR